MTTKTTSTMDAETESLVRRELSTVSLQCEGRSEGGYISEGGTFSVDTGRVFIKINRNEQARSMFEGEAASLRRLRDADIITVPAPVKVE